MNDPVTNVEIEDVLSSIRRLVSENSRPDPGADGGARVDHDTAEKTLEAVAAIAASVAPNTEPAPHVDTPEPVASDMLVLTPDHRVSEAVATETLDEGHAQEPDMTPPEVQQQKLSDDNDRMAEETHHWADDGAETAVEDIAEQATLAAAIEAVVHEALDEAVEDAFDEGEADSNEASADLPDGSEVLTFSHAESDADVDEDDGNGSLEDRIAELEAAVAERDDQWEPDGDGDEGDNAGAPVETLTWEDEQTAENQIHAWEADPLEQVEEAEVVEGMPADAGQADSQPAPETMAAPEPAPEPDMPADPQLAHDLDPEPELFADQDSVIDEDTLREMVAEIVRRELQGSLGERITRNVRKLVRSEIHRALAARELD